MDPELIKWGVTQGGIAAVLMVVLWNYRKDLKRELLEARSDKNILIELVSETKLAIEALRHALQDRLK